jgi:hypothetical protein
MIIDYLITPYVRSHSHLRGTIRATLMPMISDTKIASKASVDLIGAEVRSTV